MQTPRRIDRGFIKTIRCKILPVWKETKGESATAWGKGRTTDYSVRFVVTRQLTGTRERGGKEGKLKEYRRTGCIGWLSAYIESDN